MGQREAPRTKFNMYGKDDTKIMVYNMRKSPKRKDRKTQSKKTKKQVTKRRTLDS